MLLVDKLPYRPIQPLCLIQFLIPEILYFYLVNRQPFSKSYEMNYDEVNSSIFLSDFFFVKCFYMRSLQLTSITPRLITCGILNCSECLDVLGISAFCPESGLASTCAATALSAAFTSRYAHCNSLNLKYTRIIHFCL